MTFSVQPSSTSNNLFGYDETVTDPQIQMALNQNNNFAE